MTGCRKRPTLWQTNGLSKTNCSWSCCLHVNPANEVHNRFFFLHAGRNHDF